jgi:bifunctional DNA-binding transcriptional regulator/antitoxin component of YhaV-PrlF toxin-antitoxin module
MMVRTISMATNGEKEPKAAGESAKLMDSNGTVYVKTLPAWRERLGLKPGDAVFVIDDGKDSLIFRPMTSILNGINGQQGQQ